jgi:hypothetical protein
MQHLTLTTDSPLQLTQEENLRIETNWNSFITNRVITENDTLLRYIDHTSDTITVVSDVSYKDIVGMRFLNTPHSIPFLVLSAIALVQSKDGHLLLIPRDSGDWPKSLELPGGFIRAKMLPTDTTTFITSRVARDLGLPEDTIIETKLRDLYTFSEILEKMLVFSVTLNKSRAELLSLVPTITFLPPNYKTSDHTTHFATPLHYPSQIILEKYLTSLDF